MGSTSDMPVMEAAAKFLDSMEVPYEINALSAHRTPGLVAAFAEGAAERGIEVIIAAAGGAAHLPGVIAASTVLPVVGVPIRSSNSIDGVDSLYSIVQMPSGIPVATVAIDGAQNAAILACQILAVSDETLRARLTEFKKQLATKIEKANTDLAAVKFPYKVN
jgi:5-(carboxyamino)imidazole ribonucleotide mutase